MTGPEHRAEDDQPVGDQPVGRPIAPRSGPGYGIDTPGVLALLVVVTFALAFTGVFVGSAVGLAWSTLFWIGAAVAAALAGARIRSSARGKAEVWRSELDALGLRGDEDALDVGCGRGLVLVALARRLPGGSATGVDIWRNADQSGNAPEIPRLNASFAGVAERVVVRDGDMVALPFADASFDVVTASLALHRLRDRAARRTALTEITRVTRAGGRVVIVDGGDLEPDADALRSLGWLDVTLGERTWRVQPPARVLRARRPGADAPAPGVSPD
jgi:SAM-dependent methyltransferase